MIDDPVTARRLRDAMPVFTALAACLLVLVIGAILSLARDVLMPITLAVLLSFVLAPAVRALQRRRLPRSLAVLAVVLATFGAIGGLGLLIASETAQLAADLPRYTVTMREKIGALRAQAGGGPTLERLFEAVQDLSRELQPPDAKPRGGLSPDSEKPIPVEVREPKAGFLATLGSVAAPVLHPLATVGLILLFTLFFLAQREDLRNRAIRLAGSSDLRATTAAMDDAVARLSRFFLAQAGLNLAFGVVVAAGLWVIGVPSPILWGVLAAILRFVPYIGAVIGMAFPLLLAAAVDPGWSMLIATVVLFAIVEPVAGHVVEPLLYGHSTGLSPVAVILAATLWTFLWGPVGLVLATPITVCLVVLGRHVERLAFLDVMLGDRPALAPSEIFYQRMLAGDPLEAIDKARQVLKERALATYYDEIALGGLRLAQNDRASGALAAEQQQAVGKAIESVVTTLGHMPVPKGAASVRSAEVEATVAAVGPDRAATAIVRRPEDLAPAWRGPAPVLVVASRGPFDAAAAGMLAQVLGRHGLNTRTTSQEALARGERPDTQGVALVCLSYIEPISTSHIRLAARLARRAIPGVRVMVAIWRERDPAGRDRLRRATSADILVTTISDALDAALTLSGATETREARRRAA
ncbi:transporter [Methylobacterium variabile]|jgi:predicted PurR-regulated permease PerM|uniref:Transporter n=1 Tax=Methylobacterium variabile TaxID=298794 RepID=A0A0J6UY27_9HYPH|nr:AI-2E family transporter [Methylobacterium variabile]KMO31276.1 transporter [Methylobacterium variabile]